ncbi:hypothetical protein SNE23_30105 (plasmid) [Bacillus sp. RA(2023)]|uniref:Uncharacterized protein n=1 Tax=Bacillus thuringiensis serovar iberica TaxID=180866 RepID=A0A9X6LLK9_BACTU|nr:MULTISPECIES: hypothetical protein [Bacillus]MCU5025025.1 hypothetical protein [Bacillus cereus]HDR5352193.1 hypothetical protein [Bacillus thuringiensis]MDA2101338.1 hypothetical protein [Bacillus cereus]MDA2106947.1 hypothetical protein [Bacillus cereus]MDA2524434.1 hypothetical protein [Bacillus cereus]
MSTKYTALRGKVVIKEEFIELVNLINNGHWKEAIIKYPFLKEHYKVKGSTAVPFCKNAITIFTNPDLSPSMYGELHLETDPGHWSTDRSYFTDLQGLEWSFITCLSDYPDGNELNKTPIASFINVVLTKVASHIIRLEEYYQEWDYESVGYDFDQTYKNKIVRTSKFSYICNKCERPVFFCDGEC